MTATAQEPRPLIAIIDDAETIARARTRLASERVQAMEAALDSIGFGVDTLTGSLARLLALVADGWSPVRWTWDRLIADPKLQWGKRRRRSTDTRKNRIDSLRRALNELAAWDLIEWTTETGPKRRACRAEAVPVITLRRSTIIAESNGKISQETAGALATSSATSEATTDATSSATSQRHAGPLPYYPLIPKNTYSPLATETKTKQPGGGNDVSSSVGGVTRLKPEDVAPMAARLFDALDYRGTEGRTLWRAAAAVVAGSLTEAEIASAVRGTLARPRNDRVAAFYKFLDTQCQLCGASLSERLRAAFIVGGIPTKRPAIVPRDSRTVCKPRAAPPPIDTAAATAAAQAAFLRTLATVAGCELSQR